MTVAEIRFAAFFGVFVLMRDGFVFWLGYRHGVELLDRPWARRIVRRSIAERVGC